MNIEKIVKIIFNIDNKFQKIIGNHYFKNWSLAPEVIQYIYFRNVYLTLDEPNITIKELHINTVQIFFKHGWAYSKNFSENNKTSPQILPYFAIGERQKISYLFIISITQSFIENGAFTCGN